MQSTKLIKLVKVIETQGNKLIFEEYLTNEYFYTIPPSGQAVVFLKSKNKVYNINRVKKTLTEIVDSSKLNAIQQLKAALNETNVETEIVGEKELFKVRSKGNNITIMADFLKAKDNRLKDTLYLANSLYQSKMSIVLLPLENEDDIILEGTIDMNIHGNFIKTKFQITEIEELHEKVTRFDEILSYSIAA